jgi:nucleotide-binding universal stress UspA family protein
MTTLLREQPAARKDEKATLRILVAIDGSPSAGEAIRFLNELPLLPGTPVRLLTVTQPAREIFPEPPLGWSGRWDRAEDLLRAASAPFQGSHLDVTVAATEGDAAREIVAAARGWAADLVVVGSRGMTGLKGLVLGSVARNVAHHAPCSVLVARTPEHRIRRVVVGTDGSPYAKAAVELLSRLPLPVAAHTSVLAVSRPHAPLPVLSPMEAMLLEESAQEVTAQRLRSAEQVAEEAAVQLRDRGHWAEGAARMGDPATEILNEIRSAGADLAALGARGVSPIEKLLVGSVADRILGEASCSVLLAR